MGQQVRRRDRLLEPLPIALTNGTTGLLLIADAQPLIACAADALRSSGEKVGCQYKGSVNAAGRHALRRVGGHRQRTQVDHPTYQDH